ncbi:hypothetical protein [Kribbella italica]|uniref:Uncharacterized protein n=1 Tax=Kribbella italica TaxID=1540520 RepID=A0A7W9J5K5_9ACTN|nr:hypothetical protein [Kribbella italica]MBB5835512.1 hypothetical protein [Kribbella italica]
MSSTPAGSRDVEALALLNVLGAEGVRESRWAARPPASATPRHSLC